MNVDLVIIAAASLGLLGIITFIIVWRKRATKKPLDKSYFSQKWKESQKLCGDKTTWPLAIIACDNLLDEALKKSGYRGKSMGERLAAAQRELSDNDSV